MDDSVYTDYCYKRDELNNRKIKALELEDVLEVQFDTHAKNKLTVHIKNGVDPTAVWVANDRHLAEAFIYGVYTSLKEELHLL
jgi:hypothetical protein